MSASSSRRGRRRRSRRNGVPPRARWSPFSRAAEPASAAAADGAVDDQPRATIGRDTQEHVVRIAELDERFDRGARCAEARRELRQRGCALARSRRRTRSAGAAHPAAAATASAPARAPAAATPCGPQRSGRRRRKPPRPPEKSPFRKTIVIDRSSGTWRGPLSVLPREVDHQRDPGNDEQRADDRPGPEGTLRPRAHPRPRR